MPLTLSVSKGVSGMACPLVWFDTLTTSGQSPILILRGAPMYRGVDD